MTLDGHQVRRPVLVTSGLVLGMGLQGASVECQEGLSVQCQLEPPLCRIKVTARHFAATAGLLGVFDFDNNTDFMTSEWEMPSTEDDWAQTWRVSPDEQCSPRLPDTRIPSPLASTTCTHLFHQHDSPYSGCYRSVPPSPYLESCRAGWECEAQDAYLHACQHHYLQYTPNLACNTCWRSEEGTDDEETETGEGPGGDGGMETDIRVVETDDGVVEEVGTSGLPKEVVVVTDFECWSDPQDLISLLVGDRKKGQRVVVRYIGLGGPTEGPFVDAAETIVDSGTAPIPAILHAAALDFSPKAQKAIVFFDCDHPRCTISSRAKETEELREALLTLGIQLHVVTQAPLLVLDRQALSRRATRQLIGLDGHTAFLLSHARKNKVKGKKSLRQHLDTPIGNTCTELAVQSDGSVFSLRNIKVERRHHRRLLQQLLALRVEAGWRAEYLRCRRCGCSEPCTLCNPPPPLQFMARTSEGFEDDYDEDEERPRVRQRKRQRGRRP